MVTRGLPGTDLKKFSNRTCVRLGSTLEMTHRTPVRSLPEENEMTAPALDLAPTTHRAGTGRDGAVRGPGAGSRRARPVGAARPAARAGSSTPTRTAPAARPVRGSRGPAVAPAARLRPGVNATPRSCRGEAAPVRSRVLIRPAAAVQVGWQFTDRALALIIGVVLAVVLSAVVAVAHTAFTVTAEPTASAPAATVASVGGPSAASAG